MALLGQRLSHKGLYCKKALLQDLADCEVLRGRFKAIDNSYSLTAARSLCQRNLPALWSCTPVLQNPDVKCSVGEIGPSAKRVWRRVANPDGSCGESLWGLMRRSRI